jgi:hypothetical protein
MNIEEILELWEKDSQIDVTELGEEAVKIPKLHSKYYKIFIMERARLMKLHSEMKKLKLEKFEFYTQGPNEETRKKGWEMPAKGMILKADVPMYMEADHQIIDLSLKIGLAQEKVDFLESIIKSFNNRGYNIKSAIEWRKFTMGA